MINLKKEIEPKHGPILVLVLVVTFGVIVWIMSGVNEDSNNTNGLLLETMIPSPTQVLPTSSTAPSSLADDIVKENIASSTPQKATTSTSFDLNAVPDMVSEKQAVELIKGCYVKSITKDKYRGNSLRLINGRSIKVSGGQSSIIFKAKLDVNNGDVCGFQIGGGTVIYDLYISDFSKDDILIGASHNVFVGRVLSQSGTKARSKTPETQFTVEIISNIKGDLKGTVTVNQFGGYKNGALVTVEDDTPIPNGKSAGTYMLEPGQTYLLATRYNEQEDWHTLNSFPTARKLLSKDANASVADLKTLAQNDERVQALTAAYPNEKLLDADIQHGNTRNSYRDMGTKLQAEASKAQSSSSL